MIRSEHLFISALGLLWLAAICLWMLGIHCPGCNLYWLSTLALGALMIAVAVGSTVFSLAVWRTQRLWRLCHVSIEPYPLKLQQACQKLGITVEEIVYTAQPDAFSFCMGWLRPRIVVSVGLLEQVSASELTAILAHERHHQQQRDPLRLLVMMLIKSILYPLPAIHDFHHTFLTLIEIEADEAAIRVSGRPTVASALYKLLMQPSLTASSLQAVPVASFHACGSRLEHLLDPHQASIVPLSTPHLFLSLMPFLLLCLTMFAT